MGRGGHADIINRQGGSGRDVLGGCFLVRMDGEGLEEERERRRREDVEPHGEPPRTSIR